MSNGILSGFLGGMIGGDQANMGDGILGNLNGYMTNNAGALLGFGSGLLAGDNAMAAQGAMQGMQMDQRTRLLQQAQAEKEQRKVWAQSIAPQIGMRPEDAAMNPDAAETLWRTVQANKLTPKERSLTEQWLLRQPEDVQNEYFRRQALGGGDGVSLTPIYGTRNGKTVVMQPTKDGRLIESQMPEGVEIASGYEKIDLGTHYQLRDKRTGAVVGNEMKDVAGAARSTEIGKAEGAAIAGAGAQASAADDALNITKQIKEHPRLDAAVGPIDGRTGAWRGDTQAFIDLVDQAKSGAFLTAVQNLKGLGAMSEYEAKSATSAINRMNRATDKPSFLKAVSDYEAVIMRAKQKAQALQRQGGSAPASGGGRLRFDAQGNPM